MFCGKLGLRQRRGALARPGGARPQYARLPGKEGMLWLLG